MFEIKDDSPIKQRRLKQFWVPLKEFQRIVTTGEDCPYIDRCENGLPADAEICGIMYSLERHCFSIIAAHKSFDSVPEGQIIPNMDIAFKRVTK